MSKKINVSIVWATWYTWVELLKILLNHKNVDIKYLVSANNAWKKINELYPHLTQICEIELEKIDLELLVKWSDLVFFSLPYWASQEMISKIYNKVKIIDLSADFRIKDTWVFEKYYWFAQIAESVNEQAVYGLVEKNKNEIKSASLVANPWCFATAIELALLPFKWNIKGVNVFAQTGSSWSWKSARDNTHHPIRSHNVLSYKIWNHQHLAEIIQEIEIEESQINFVPSSWPFVRWIFATCFIELKADMSADAVKKLFKKQYENDFFVRIKDKIELAQVVWSNFCDISITKVNWKFIIQSCIDNLIKGAWGTAVQNMNLMFWFEEGEGVDRLVPVYP